MKGKDKFIAMQKNMPFESDNPDPIREHGVVYFEFGETQEEAFAKLLRAQHSENLTKSRWAQFSKKLSGVFRRQRKPLDKE